MKSRPPAGGRSALALVVATNLLPLAGVVGFGWRVGELLAVYWIEVAALVIAHAAAAMFAERPIRLEDRSFYITGYDEDAERDEVWETDAEPVHLVSWLPPIYRRNFRVVRRSLGVFAFMMFPLLAVGWEALSYLTPTVGVATLGVCGAQVGEVRREFFAERAYEDQSPYMVVEAAQRVVFFYFVVAILTVVSVTFGIAVIDVVLAPGLLDGVADAVLLVPYLLPIALGKATVEWSRRRAFQEDDPDGIATWFTGEDARRDWKKDEESVGDA
ncbi:DUF6498-containing protein [Halorubrum ezzemoulense]|uniref:DUF6498-containing protein n=1 Tax=Halorubrum ezzemoulense TaxID=337243 RepID=A0A256IUB3_HALEZ|nr:MULTISPECIES: DUF6498-containing protein [Halorubrum]MDB2224883.1 DUF6498-containing protein [Halorubrum ezzemoulense]MDB2245461.1 DUF6498-containing protein [Halorubrum ezzemoulense]MDB2250347.1 DUF6498-containing protein [Halorubrum ezzemoulense]MDB2259956.1 DUF6498-containing protein [Halorubrum ezzemoulense]MDB2262722.1 DUF6498-containing protein [Halorubrum ezzemoulense]